MKVKDILFYPLLVWFLISFAVGVLYVRGYEVSFAFGNSMEPTLKGECYYLRKRVLEPYDAIQISDIIVFKKGLHATLHRVVEKCEGGFITQGDNNKYSDGCIPYDYLTHKFILDLYCWE